MTPRQAFDTRDKAHPGSLVAPTHFRVREDRVDQTGNAIPPSCQTGADCVFSRYVAAGRGPDLAAAGAVDASTFTGFYWGEQFRTAFTVLLLTTVGGVGGAVLYGVAGPKAAARQPDAVTPIA